MLDKINNLIVKNNQKKSVKNDEVIKNKKTESYIKLDFPISYGIQPSSIDSVSLPVIPRGTTLEVIFIQKGEDDILNKCLDKNYFKNFDLTVTIGRSNKTQFIYTNCKLQNIELPIIDNDTDELIFQATFVVNQGIKKQTKCAAPNCKCEVAQGTPVCELDDLKPLPIVGAEDVSTLLPNDEKPILYQNEGKPAPIMTFSSGETTDVSFEPSQKQIEEIIEKLDNKPASKKRRGRPRKNK